MIRTRSRFLIVSGMIAVLALAATAAGAAPKGGGNASGSGGKGGGGTSGSGTLSLKMVNDANGDNLPNYGDSVTFNVSTTASRPYVVLDCTQGGASVYSSSAGFYP